MSQGKPVTGPLGGPVAGRMGFSRRPVAGGVAADQIAGRRGWEKVKEEFYDKVRRVDPLSARIVADQLAEITEAIGFQVNRVPYEAQQFIHIALATIASLGEALREVQRRGGN